MSRLRYIPLVLIPVVILLGAVLFQDKQYALISLLVTVLAILMFFFSFERREHNTRRIVLLAVMTALSVAGRFIFAPIPFFKPVTAIVIIAAVYFGSEFGFMVGAFSAVISNFYFGQGPWTPFQMFSWGLIGFIAGLLSNPILRSKIVLIIYSAISGVLYSLLMDIWTVLWADAAFNAPRYIAAVATSLPIMLQYIVSNVIFVLVLMPLIGTKIERLKTKYEI